MRVVIILFYFIHFSLSAQQDSLNQKLENYFFSFDAEIGDMLLFNISNITHSKVNNFKGFKQKVWKEGNKIEIIFRYKDDNWHEDAFQYKINLDSLNKSTYLFFDKQEDSTKGYFGYSIKSIDTSYLTFIDSLNVNVGHSIDVIYKFKTMHSVEDSNDVCMLHFISPKIGLISRQSNIWWCTSANSYKFSYDKGFCAFEDRNHFSLLNISNQFVEVEKLGKKVKEEQPNWIIRALRTGDPIDSTILSFYNDTVACNCSYDALFNGYFEYLSKKKSDEGLTRKQIKKIGRRDKRYYRWYERMERKGKVDEHGNVIR